MRSAFTHRCRELYLRRRSSKDMFLRTSGLQTLPVTRFQLRSFSSVRILPKMAPPSMIRIMSQIKRKIGIALFLWAGVLAVAGAEPRLRAVEVDRGIEIGYGLA